MNNIYNRKKAKIKKVISMKQFISEFGENFSDHMKKRLLELEIRCVLTRQEDDNRVDLKHVEHTHYNSSNTEDYQKEYVYGQFIVIDGALYFSEGCAESDDVMQSPVVSVIYNSLNSEDISFDEYNHAKKVDDSNIDYVIDTILTVFPQVSQAYIDIISRYI